MSQQIEDLFIWEGESWVFLGAENVYSLFDPDRFGLKPVAPHTGCWKGFVIQFRMNNGQLILDRLHVHCERLFYPRINGVRPKRGEWGLKAYYNINLRLSYSGTIIVGKKMLAEYKDCAFTGPYSYKTTFELLFKNGMLVGTKETSGSYSGF